MRIVSYNIMDGGEGRADPIGEVIEAQKADLVALAEATDKTVVERIANRLKMDFIIAPGKKSGTALLSRFPIEETINHALIEPDITRACLEAVVTLPSKQRLAIGVVHLHSRSANSDEAIRMKEIAAILKIFEPRRSRGEMHLLAGDFNSNSPAQQVKPDKLKPTTRKAWDANGGSFPRQVVQTLLDAGYVDSFAAVDPALAQSATTFTTQIPAQRIDYIFAYNAKSISKAWVELDRLAKYASDHFPIGAEIE